MLNFPLFFIQPTLKRELADVLTINIISDDKEDEYDEDDIVDLDIKADASELVALEYEFDECKHGKQMMVNKLYGKIHVRTPDALLPNRGKQSLVPGPEKLVLPVTYFRYQRTSDIRLFNQIQCRHVARIFDRGGCLRAKRVSLGRGLGAQPSAGSRGGAPCRGLGGRGLGGRSPPEIFKKYGVVHEFWQ